MVLMELAAAVWMNSQAEIRMEQANSEAALQESKLNSQIELEQDRVRQLRERNLMGKNILDAWIKTADNHEDEVLATANMLFLYTISTSGFLGDDPVLAEKILNRRVGTAEGYLATLTPENSSPIQRAQWHEMLGAWYAESNDPQGIEHLNEAARLISMHAPTDILWREKIEMLLLRYSSP